MSTLSVDTSTSGSSTSTLSPTFFSQRVTVPSVTDSPSSGIITDVASPPPDDCAAGFGSGSGSGFGASCSSAAGSGSCGRLLGRLLLRSAGFSSRPARPAPRRRLRPPRRSPPARRRPRRCRPPGRRSSSARPRRATGSRCRPCRWRPRAAARPASTVSPSCLSQRVTVPSVTLSPSAGIWTEMAMSVDSLERSVVTGRMSGSHPVTSVRAVRRRPVGLDALALSKEVEQRQLRKEYGPVGTVRQVSARRRRGRSRGNDPAADLAYLQQWVAEHAGVEAFVEPKTTVTEVTVVLVAADGEWTRRRAGGDAGARRLSERLQDPRLRRAEGRLPAADARLRRTPADRTRARRSRGTRRPIGYRRSH